MNATRSQRPEVEERQLGVRRASTTCSVRIQGVAYRRRFRRNIAAGRNGQLVVGGVGSSASEALRPAACRLLA